MTWTSIKRMKFRKRIAEINYEEEKIILDMKIKRCEILLSKMKNKKRILELEEIKNRIEIKRDLHAQKMEVVELEKKSKELFEKAA